MNTQHPDPSQAELDDLIMRLKDCISHEDKPDQYFGDRCITKAQFKQQVKAKLTTWSERHAKRREIESQVKQTVRCYRQTALLDDSQVRKEWFDKEIAALQTQLKALEEK